MLSILAKKLWIVAGICFALCLVNPQTALAGEINSNEQGVLSAAGGTFYYGGQAYVAADTYLKQLRRELQEDDVDLTAKEANDAITEMYGSIKQGIDEGYLVKVKDSSSKGSDAKGGSSKTGNNNVEPDAKSTAPPEDTDVVQKVPDDGGTDKADAEREEEDTKIFSFLDASVSPAGRIVRQTTTAGAVTGAYIIGTDVIGSDSADKNRGSLTDALMIVLGVIATGSACLLYAHGRPNGICQQADGRPAHK